MSTICGTLERILSCRGITRSGLRSHPGSLGHVSINVPIRHVAIQAETVDVLSRHAPVVHAPPVLGVVYTAPAPIVEYLSAASAVDAAPAPVVVHIRPAPVALQHRWCMLHPSPSWRTFLQLPALGSSSASRGLHRSVYTSHLSLCTFSLRLRCTEPAVVEYTSACLELCRASACGMCCCAFLHLQQFPLIMDTRLARHVGIQAETLSVCMSKRTRRVGRRSAEPHLFEYVCF